jgi:hypothetical protein
VVEVLGIVLPGAVSRRAPGSKIRGESAVLEGGKTLPPSLQIGTLTPDDEFAMICLESSAAPRPRRPGGAKDAGEQSSRGGARRWLEKEISNV